MVTEYISAREIKAHLCCSTAQAYRIMSQIGELRLGRMRRVRREDFEAFLARNTQPGAAA